MNNIIKVLADGDIPWWSILVFVDEPECPQSILERI